MRERLKAFENHLVLYTVREYCYNLTDHLGKKHSQHLMAKGEMCAL